MVFTENNPASNGACAWVATTTYSLGKAVQFRKDLGDGLNNSAEMLADNRAAIAGAAKDQSFDLARFERLCAEASDAGAEANPASTR